MEWILAIILSIICVYGIVRRNYISVIFNGIWSVVLIMLANTPEADLRSDSWTILTLMLIFVNVGLIYGTHFSKRKRVTIGGKSIIHIRTSSNISEIIVRRLLFLCIIIFTYYFAITISRIGTLNLGVIRNSSSEIRFSGTIDTIAYFIIGQPMFTTTSIALIYAGFRKQKIRTSTWILFTICAALYLIANAGRIFIILLVCIVLAGIFRNKRYDRNNDISLKKLIMFSAIAFIVLAVMTNSRNGGKITFIQQAKNYFVCSVLHMDVQMESVDVMKNTMYYFGYIALGGFLYFPIKMINVLFGTSILAPGELLQYLQKITPIVCNGKTVYYNALVPNAFYFYFDSGYLGVVIFSLMSGVLAGNAQKKSANGQFLYFAMYAMLIYCLLLSPLGSQFWKINIPLTIVWCVVFNCIGIEEVYKND